LYVKVVWVMKKKKKRRGGERERECARERVA
jgi:hypothetical protein